jgi:signal recognition particle subunit SRP54
VQVQEVNRMLAQFDQMQTMMKQFSGGKMARMMGQMAAKGVGKGLGKGFFK